MSVRFLVRLAAVTALVLRPLVSGAQDGALRGVVTDSAGKPIAEADVAIVAQQQLTRTDAQGRFAFANLPRGEHEVSVRRLGYRPASARTMVGDLAYLFSIVLVAQPATVAGVEVSASAARLRLGIEDFYRRQARGTGGAFITRADIQRRNARRTTDVLRTIPSVRVVRTRGVNGIRFSSGAGNRNCTPTVWLDGQDVENMELDNIPVHDIEGIEVYDGPASTPMQFSHPSSRTDCGAVVIWTRIPGRP